MLKNAVEAAKRYMRDSFVEISDDSFVIQEVKGYMTTNVYKLLIKGPSVLKCLYIKESADLNNATYNDFIIREYDNTEYIYKNFPSTAVIKTVKPVTIYKDFNVFIMEEIQGDRLDNVFKEYIKYRRFDEIKSLIQKCKEWLHAFHEIKIDGSEVVVDLMEIEAKKINFIHKKFLQKCSKSELSDIEKIFSELSSRRASLNISSDNISYKHNDFAPWNIIYENNSLTVYDFADLAIDYKYYDLIYFAHSLDKLSNKIPFSRFFVNKLKQQVVLGEGIPKEVYVYYIMYFNLQDAASYLSKSHESGLKSYVFKYMYRKKIRSLKKYLS